MAIYPAHEIIQTEDPWAELSRVNADYAVVLAAGDVPMDDMLYAFADALNGDPSLDVVYGDEMTTDQDGEPVPFWKPDWSPDYLESFNYIGRTICFRPGLVADASITCQFDLVLRLTERTGRIAHVRSILASTAPEADLAATRSADIAALEGRLARTGRTGLVAPLEGSTPAYRVTLDERDRPLVSIVIPTAGRSIRLGSREVDLITTCVSSIKSLSTYPRYEIIVVDNGDLTQGQVEELSAQGCRRVTFEERDFNVAKKLNLGAREARGEYLLLMNDDIQIISADWIERMADHLAKPHVGVVGAKLLYPDDTIQHAGVVFYHGNPDHVRRKVPRTDHGYFCSTCVSRNFIAVTGACMLTRAELYRRVEGYTESLAVSYNDADFCFKLGEIGYTTVYEPRAELYHFESKSRVPSLDLAELAYFQTRWAGIVSDPFYNDLELTVASPTFEVRANDRLV